MEALHYTLHASINKHYPRYLPSLLLQATRATPNVPPFFTNPTSLPLHSPFSSPPPDPQQQESSSSPAGLTPAGRWIFRSEG